jgi:hypothetical protein
MREAAMYRRHPIAPTTTVRRKSKSNRIRRMFSR